MKKTAILIDNAYLEALCRAYSVSKLDVRKLGGILLKDDEELYRTYVFDSLPFVPEINATEDQKDRRDRKHQYLDRRQYIDRVTVELGEVRPKKTTCRKCRQEFEVPAQKLVDVRISVRLVSPAMSKSVETIVLLTGDRDIPPAVEAVENSGTTIRLIYAEEPVQGIYAAKKLIQKSHEKRKLSRQDLEYCRLVEESE